VWAGGVGGLLFGYDIGVVAGALLQLSGASLLAAVLTEIYLCNVCSCHEKY
jgi:hypothetical protein